MLYSRGDAARKYLNAGERAAFLAALAHADRETRTFASTLVYTGCRLGEALALTADRIDVADGTVILETLKRRRRGVFRAVPVPRAYLDMLDLAHNLRALQRARTRGTDVRLWPWSRGTAWARVRGVMQTAGLAGPRATARGLRHAYGVQAVTTGVPLHLLQRWLGHAQLSTTAIYADVSGEEAHHLMERMWAPAAAPSGTL